MLKVKVHLKLGWGGMKGIFKTFRNLSSFRNGDLLIVFFNYFIWLY